MKSHLDAQWGRVDFRETKKAQLYATETGADRNAGEQLDMILGPRGRPYRERFGPTYTAMIGKDDNIHIFGGTMTSQDQAAGSIVSDSPQSEINQLGKQARRVRLEEALRSRLVFLSFPIHQSSLTRGERSVRASEHNFLLNSRPKD
jgi:hypothetical protein